MRKYIRLAIAILISEAAGIIGSLFTAPNISTWYAELARPQLSPPNWLFAPVWTTLFALMGIALFLVYEKRSSFAQYAGTARGSQNIRTWWVFGIVIFFVQLVLNTLWSIIFFGFRNPGAAFGEIIILWLAILATIIAFFKISKTAGWLLVPYLLWVGFAAYLNYSIWVLN